MLVGPAGFVQRGQWTDQAAGFSITAFEACPVLAWFPSMAGKTETLEGFVVDIACLRKYSPQEWQGLGPRHTKRCSLMGHCVESGFGLVGEDGGVALLDAEATAGVVDRLRESGSDEGIRLRVRREEREGEMRTVGVDEV